MGQPVTVLAKPSSRPGVVRYEINRAITGTGHEVYTAEPDPLARRPVDEMARRLFATGRVASVHANSNVITVQLVDGAGDPGLAPIIEELFTYYREGVRVPRPEDFGAPADA